MTPEAAEFIKDINKHFVDIVMDVMRVSVAFNETAKTLGKDCGLTDDGIKDRLSDISNQLDDLVRELKGTPDDQPSTP